MVYWIKKDGREQSIQDERKRTGYTGWKEKEENKGWGSVPSIQDERRMNRTEFTG